MKKVDMLVSRFTKIESASQQKQ